MSLHAIRSFTVALTLAALSAAGLVHAQKVRGVDVHRAQALNSQGALLLDVREAHEYSDGHAPGSLLIPVGHLQHRLKEIEAFQNKPVVVICRSGKRSAKAVELLQKAGFTDAHNVVGGMIAWEKAGLPVQKNAK